MKITIPIAASAVALTLILAGCAPAAPGTSSGASGASGGGGGSASGPTGNYTADSLVAILKKVEVARSISGTISDNAQLKADQSGAGSDSLTQEFSGNGGAITPKACGTLLDSLISEGEKETRLSNWTGATLVATNDIISVAATANSSDTAELIAKTRSIMSQVTSQCSTITLKNSSITLEMSIKPASATTNASQTYAYEEDITSAGTTTKTLTVEAVYGNLYIGDVSISSPNASDLEANVNAVIAASH